MPTEGSESQTRKPPLAGGVHAQVVPSLLGLGQILLRPPIVDDVRRSAPHLPARLGVDLHEGGVAELREQQQVLRLLHLVVGGV